MKRSRLVQNRNGAWMVAPEENVRKEKVVMGSCVNPIENLGSYEKSEILTKENLFAIIYSILLGVSAALNIYQYMLLKSYFDIIRHMQ